MGASDAARMAQSTSGKAYGIDTWIDVRLEPMMSLWQGIGGSSNFFISEHDVREHIGLFVNMQATQFAETLWRQAQVGPSPRRGYRDGIREFVVDIACDAAMGICTNNPQFGSGSILQYYVPDWERALYATGRQHRFAQVNH